MSSQSEMNKLDQVTGEFTRLMIVYWDMLGKPPLAEFLSLLPLDPALEHIKKEEGSFESHSDDPVIQ
jgi:hypothetical protein